MKYIKAKLANRVLKVPEEDKERYIQQGYTIYDTDGNVIAEPPTDSNKLKAAQEEIADLNEKLKAADEAIAEKDKEIADLNEKLKAATTAKTAKASTAKKETDAK